MHYFAGEPTFVRQPENSTSGAVICQLFDAEHVTSAFAIFDALAVARGPKAVIRLRAPIHLGFHAYFKAEGKES